MTVEASARTGPRTAGSTAVVGVFRTHQDAEAAIKALEGGGFDMRTLSLVGKGYQSEQHPIGYYNTGDRMKHWGKLGAFWGGVWGLLVGSAFFWVPGIGPLLLGGPLVSALVGALEGAVIIGGLSALGAALYSMGIPKNSVIDYETAIKADKYLLVGHGPPAAVPGMRDVIQRAGADRVDVHEKRTS